MMHTEPTIPSTLPPPLPLPYEQDLKSHAFVDFINQTASTGVSLGEPLDSSQQQQQQYSNYIPHPSYHQSTNEEQQFYSTARATYPSYPYPYGLPPYPSLALDTGMFIHSTNVQIDLEIFSFF